MPPAEHVFGRGGAGSLAALLTAACTACGAPAGPPVEAALFVDVAAAAGLDFVHFSGMSGRLYFSEMTGAGGALFDYDGDGDLDVYLVQGHVLGDVAPSATTFPAPEEPLVDRLFRSDAVSGGAATALGVRYVDVTAASGLAAAGYGMGVASGDVDDDGAPDLYVTNHGANELWRNRGDGSFVRLPSREAADRRWGTSAAFLDYDGDGRLDLFVANYVDYRVAAHKPCLDDAGAPDYCGPLSYAPQDDLLLRNRGDGSFEDATRAAGLAGSPGAGLGVAVADYDGDRRLDIYVANDQMRNFLWINQGDGTFVDEALLAGAAVDAHGRAQASMGVDAGDLDGDGDEDLFMTHLRGESNTVYRNQGRGMFHDVSAATRLGPPSVPYTGFGTVLLDVDLDGWLDLAVANGAVRILGAQRRAGEPLPLREPNQLFRNRGDGTFEEIGARLPSFARAEVSRGLASGDLDNDGDPDLLLTNNSGPVRLLLNRQEGGNRWLGVRALTASGRDALGARLTVVQSSQRRIERRVRTDGSYCSAGDPRVLFGLGADAAPAALEVRWPGGAVQRFVDPVPDRLLTVREPADD